MKISPSSLTLPSRFHRLLWDVNVSEVRLPDHAGWVVERVLEYGDLEDVQALARLLGRGPFLELVARARIPSSKTKRFWDQVLTLEGVSCTRKSSRETVWI